MWQPADCVTCKFSLSSSLLLLLLLREGSLSAALLWSCSTFWHVSYYISCAFSDGFLHTVETAWMREPGEVPRGGRPESWPDRFTVSRCLQVTLTGETGPRTGAQQQILTNRKDRISQYHHLTAVRHYEIKYSSFMTGKQKQRLHLRRSWQMFTDVESHILLVEQCFWKQESVVIAIFHQVDQQEGWSAVRNTLSCGTPWLTDLFLDNNGALGVTERHM